MPGAGSEKQERKSPGPEVARLLEKAYLEFNNPGFIPEDPVSIPHQYTKKEDIEIAAFFAAILAWGNRKTILDKTLTLMEWMDRDPHAFILGFRDRDLQPFTRFVHRTFNGDDCLFFLHSLQRIYRDHGSLENVFVGKTPGMETREAIAGFRKVFFSPDHLVRTEKHIANPEKNASAKRINMFLRWMVRRDDRGVDFGIWECLKPSMLMCPLDVHTGNVSRQLGLLHRKQDDWKAVEELTASLRLLDPVDPVKYDIALFGLGVYHLL